MNNFVPFLKASNHFKDKNLEKKFFLFIKKNTRKDLTDKQIKKIVKTVINSKEFLISGFMKNLLIIDYPFHYTDIKIKYMDKEIFLYSLDEHITSLFKNKKKLIDYFILKFDNKRESKFKENPLKILKSKIKYNGSIFMLTSVLYSNGDILKIQYKNIYDLTDDENEIRQEYFYLNNKIIKSKDILDNYEKHNGDDEYIRENDYNNRIIFCLYEKYDQNDKRYNFIEHNDYPEIDIKYKRIHEIYNTNLKLAKEKMKTTDNKKYLEYVASHILKPVNSKMSYSISSI